MALSESALSDLLASLQVADGVDLVRELARWALQELIEAEAAAAIGAGRYERTEGRVTERNGHRPRVLSTKAGDLHVAIPKLRAGSFFPSLLEPRRRIDQALYAVVMEAYVAGVSTRAVDDLVAAMGLDSGISKSEVSANLCRTRRARRRVPWPHTRSHRLPVRVPRRHLRACPRRRPGAGRVPSGRHRHRHHRLWRPGDPRRRPRRQRGRDVLDRLPAQPASTTAPGARWPCRDGNGDAPCQGTQATTQASTRSSNADLCHDLGVRLGYRSPASCAVLGCRSTF